MNLSVFWLRNPDTDLAMAGWKSLMNLSVFWLRNLSTVLASAGALPPNRLSIWMLRPPTLIVMSGSSSMTILLFLMLSCAFPVTVVSENSVTYSAGASASSSSTATLPSMTYLPTDLEVGINMLISMVLLSLSALM